MAQIKKKMKPGQAIIKAKTGNVAGIDKDGNIIGTPISFGEVMIDPVGGSQGDVLTKKGGGGYWWQTAEDARIKNVTNKFSYTEDMESWIDSNEEFIEKIQYDAIQIGPFVLFTFFIHSNDVASDLPTRIFDIDPDFMDEYSYKVIPSSYADIYGSTPPAYENRWLSGSKYSEDEVEGSEQPHRPFDVVIAQENNGEGDYGVYVYDYVYSSGSYIPTNVQVDTEKLSGSVLLIIGGST